MSTTLKPVNQKAWLLILPVVLCVAFSAILPLMTVVNYSVQDIISPERRVFVGTEWFKSVMRDDDLQGALLRQITFSLSVLLVEIPLGIALALSMPAKGWKSSLVLVLAGPWLMWQWVGAAVPANPALLWMLGLWKILESAGLALAMFLNGAGVMRLQVLTALIMLAATVLIKPWMVGEMGIVGAPLSTALIYFVVTLVPLAFVIRRELRRIRALPARAPQQGSA